VDELGAQFVRDLDQDYRMNGAEAVARFRKDEPVAYFRLLQSLVPEHATSWNTEFLQSLTDEQHAALAKVFLDYFAQFPDSEPARHLMAMFSLGLSEESAPRIER
jgi:hypothetical protein